MFDEQRDHDPTIQAFHTWVKTSCSLGTLGPAECVNEPFMPLQKLETYLKQSSRTLQLLQALFPDSEPPVHPEEIWQKCTRGFAILLLIGKGKFIQQFVQHDSLWDEKLPLTFHPPDFPNKSDDAHFFESFAEKQWTFCPRTFGKTDIDIRLRKEQILPIIHKELIGTGGSAETYVIKLHAAYDQLTPIIDFRRDPTFRFANTYVLKTYRSKDAEHHYRNEVNAFKHLIGSGALGKSIIGFYGSYVQEETYNVLLEYADRGTLEEYLLKQPPPSSGEDIKKFWTAIFNLIQALVSIHAVPGEDKNAPPVLRGWHQDVKPANILVSSSSKGDSVYDCEFRLADLGLSHFRKVTSQEGSNFDKDTSGTREYGAPECYRFDDFMERQPLNIKQTVDLWSLGCVYSESAVWVVLGKGRLIRYREMRKDETGRLWNFRDRGCFHDGDKALTSVKKMHTEVFDNVRISDHITKSVVKKLINEMLDQWDGRPTAVQSWRKSRQILEDAVVKINTPRSSSPTFGPSQSDRAQTDMHSTRKPPEVPPESTHTNSSPIPLTHGSREWPPDPERKIRSASVNISHHGRARTPDDDTRYATDFGTPSRPSITPLMSSPRTTRSQQRDPDDSADYHPREQQNSDGDPFPEQRRMEFDGASKDAQQNHNGPSRLSIQPRGLAIDGGPISVGRSRLSCDHSPAPASSVSLHSEQHMIEKSEVANTESAQRPTLPYLKLSDALSWYWRRKRNKKADILENTGQLNDLGFRDHVFLVDNAQSMKPHWDCSGGVVDVFRVLAWLLKHSDKDGIDLYFTRTPGKHNSKKTKGLIRYVEGKEKGLSGTSDMGASLGDILHRYEVYLRQHEASMPKRRFLFGSPKEAKSPAKPLNVYILTDGVWQPHCDVEEPIRALVETMKELKYPRKQVGIQFVRFGNDRNSIKKLEYLDDDLGLGKMDIVDTEPADGNVWKMLVGAVNKWFDNGEHD